MARNRNRNRYRNRPFPFALLRDSTNYKQWATSMKDALLRDHLWVYISANSSPPPAYTVTDPTDPEQEEQAFQREQEINQWQCKQHQCVGRIALMCSEAVQRRIAHVKRMDEGAADWKPKELWDFLAEKYTEKGWIAKWRLVDRLPELTLKRTTTKEVQILMSRMCDFISQGQDLNITLGEFVVITMLNNLPPEFAVHRALMREKAWKEETVPSGLEISRIVEDWISARNAPKFPFGRSQ
ncbi:MAG: hypothetical protein Q9201_002323 [Fulgogasparrea decipioides]